MFVYLRLKSLTEKTCDDEGRNKYWGKRAHY